MENLSKKGMLCAVWDHTFIVIGVLSVFEGYLEVELDLSTPEAGQNERLAAV